MWSRASLAPLELLGRVSALAQRTGPVDAAARTLLKARPWPRSRIAC